MDYTLNKDYSDSLLIRDTISRFIELISDDINTIAVGQAKGKPERGKKENAHLGHEMFLQISGKCNFSFPGRQYLLSPSKGLIVPSGLSHQEKVVQTVNNPFCNLVFIFMEQCTTVHIARAFSTTGIPKPNFMEMLNNTSAEFYYHSLSTFINLPKQTVKLGSEILQVVLSKVLLDLGSPTENNVWNFGQDVPQGDPQKIERVKQYINDNVTSIEINNKILSDLVGYSPNYLSHLFKKITGESIREYINRKKLEAGLFMLENTPYSIQEISYKLGYLDPAYFAKLFNRQYGQNPSQLRKHRPQLE